MGKDGTQWTHWTQILNSNWVVVLVSIIWGIGIALLFRKTCGKEQCQIYKVPPDFRSQVIYAQGKCYRLYKYPAPCRY